MSEYVAERVIQKNGGSNQISLPMHWIRAHSLRPGDKVKVVYNGVLKVLPITQTPLELEPEPLDIEVKDEYVFFKLGDNNKRLRTSKITKYVHDIGFDETLNKLKRMLEKHYSIESIEASHEQLQKILNKVCSEQETNTHGRNSIEGDKKR